MIGFQIADWIITYIESVVALAAVLAICGLKYTGKRYWGTLLFTACGNTLGVAVLNHISAFSFFTPVFSVLFLFVAARFLSNGERLLRAAAGIMVPFVILSIGYALMIILCLIYGGDFIEIFNIFMQPGWMRMVLLFADKLADIFVFCTCRKYLGQMRQLSRRWLIVLFSFSCVFYGLTQYLFGAILSGEYMRLHRASVLSFLVLILFFISLSMLLLSISAREKQSMQQRILEKTNQMMEQNYKMMHADLQENAKRLHDFHHHLKVISGLAEQTQDDAVTEYISSLLEISYRETAMCRSGSDIIDAVINCSAAEAEKHSIRFEYELYFTKMVPVAAVDLCAVLGNQIENAIEANLEADISQRYVRVVLTQKDGFFISKVLNFAAENPFAADGTLITKKEDKKLHGLGIMSIENTVEKYNGYIRNSYANHTFISEALMCVK